jgi:thioredoxin-dependent peroxiredoxin
MAEITLRGNPIQTNGELPAAGSKAPEFTLLKTDLSELNSTDLKGKRVILNIFPSIDTPVCQTSARAFNEKASGLENTTVVCASMDLPFAMSRFCGAEGLEAVVPASAFRSDFASDYGVKQTSGPLQGLTARAVVVIDEEGTVKYSQLVGEIADEPDYDAAIASLS